MARKVARQPNSLYIQTTTTGAIVAPMVAPESQTEVAKPRSLTGNHSATVLAQPGETGPSPEARRKRQKPRPKTDPTSVCNTLAVLPHSPAMAMPARAPILSITRPPKIYASV
ncbi:MAG: hypothetical protein BWX70_01664 [Verrucomicrobia bacterium ADurb.Bin070]|nr:MAG: hypothetical protein BWX70_01664 [Verrucomicrobia bacterium ADurb.Bin070]